MPGRSCPLAAAVATRVEVLGLSRPRSAPAQFEHSAASPRRLALPLFPQVLEVSLVKTLITYIPLFGCSAMMAVCLVVMCGSRLWRRTPTAQFNMTPTAGDASRTEAPDGGSGRGARRACRPAQRGR